jgi:hypothetical protein
MKNGAVPRKRNRDQSQLTRPFPEALLAEALAHPNGWVYEIRSGVDPMGAVPPEDIAGAWAIDEAGHPTGTFTPNPKYRAD